MRRGISILLAVVFAVGALVSAGCMGSSDADVAAKNLSKAAEQFEIPRRIVFINGITDTYLFTIEGYCSIDPAGAGLRALAVVCRDGGDGNDATFKKYYFGLADNVTYTVEQLEGTSVSVNHVRVIFKPETIVPDFDRP